MSDRPKNPPGWWTLPVEVATDGDRIILVGEPPSEEDDPRCDAHDCDAMGCRQSHVLASFDLDYVQEAALAHLVRAGRAKDGPGPRPESIRESVLRRIRERGEVPHA